MVYEAFRVISTYRKPLSWSVTLGSRRGAYKAGVSCQAGEQRADPRDDREQRVLQDTQASGP